MIKNEADVIYNRLKNKVGFDRSKKFKNWFHKEYPNSVMHHLFGSYSQSLKTSDYCSVPLLVSEHSIAEKDKSDFAIDHLHEMTLVMIAYIKFLESKRSADEWK